MSDDIMQQVARKQDQRAMDEWRERAERAEAALAKLQDEYDEYRDNDHSDIGHVVSLYDRAGAKLAAVEYFLAITEGQKVVSREQLRRRIADGEAGQ